MRWRPPRSRVHAWAAPHQRGLKRRPSAKPGLQVRAETCGDLSKGSDHLNAQRGFWFIVGCLALALGGIGVVLPVLPTTPFVILAAFAFGKSSPRLQAWLENNRTFGPMIADWKQNGAIAPRYKAVSVIMMAGFFGLSIWMGFPAVVRIVQAVAMGFAAAFVLSRPNGPGE